MLGRLKKVRNRKKNMKAVILICFLVAVAFGQNYTKTALDEYVALPDGAQGYRLINTLR